ncbi:hypothetical protein HORIV_21970 [Vreelandella olivaria]|uniref:FMN-dependent dehydrogenase domain-containing protein n=1 Tax=Vreelandella olivaria TaxID=390919 RepID=A0ABM9SCT5_9GAMM|nr:hypothetical protein HORIV_21970 [Halomonas olivaria]
MPKAFVNVAQIDLHTELYGKRYAVPFGIAPMGISALSTYQGGLSAGESSGEAQPANDYERVVPGTYGRGGQGRGRRLVSGLSAGNPGRYRGAIGAYPAGGF